MNQFKYKIGDHIRFHCGETFTDIRTGSWTENVIRTGYIVQIHPENRRCYEVNHDMNGNYKVNRVSERAVIGKVFQY